jgi:hypothetical protein
MRARARVREGKEKYEKRLNPFFFFYACERNMPKPLIGIRPGLSNSETMGYVIKSRKQRRHKKVPGASLTGGRIKRKRRQPRKKGKRKRHRRRKKKLKNLLPQSTIIP